MNAYILELKENIYLFFLPPDMWINYSHFRDEVNLNHKCVVLAWLYHGMDLGL